MKGPKSYNKSALRGYAYDDKEFQIDMEELGVSIPNNLLYTPKGPEFVMNHYRDTNEQGYLRQGMEPAEAKITANKVYSAAMTGYKDLLKLSKKK
jgi:hypothetical protein